MDRCSLYYRLLDFAVEGSGQELLDGINSRLNGCYNCSKLGDKRLIDDVLFSYCEVGLPKEIDRLKSEGSLRRDRYDVLGDGVVGSCCSDRYGEFIVSLRRLLNKDVKRDAELEGRGF